jgi:hypothetical protein
VEGNAEQKPSSRYVVIHYTALAGLPAATCDELSDGLWRSGSEAGRLRYMPHRPPRKKQAQVKAGDLENRQLRSQQLATQRRQSMTTHSILSRLRNRKSDIK